MGSPHRQARPKTEATPLPRPACQPSPSPGSAREEEETQGREEVRRRHPLTSPSPLGGLEGGRQGASSRSSPREGAALPKGFGAAAQWDSPPLNRWGATLTDTP